MIYITFLYNKVLFARYHICRSIFAKCATASDAGDYDGHGPTAADAHSITITPLFRAPPIFHLMPKKANATTRKMPHTAEFWSRHSLLFSPSITLFRALRAYVHVPYTASHDAIIEGRDADAAWLDTTR